MSNAHTFRASNWRAGNAPGPPVSEVPWNIRHDSGSATMLARSLSNLENQNFGVDLVQTHKVRREAGIEGVEQLAGTEVSDKSGPFLPVTYSDGEILNSRRGR